MGCVMGRGMLVPGSVLCAPKVTPSRSPLAHGTVPSGDAGTFRASQGVWPSKAAHHARGRPAQSCSELQSCRDFLPGWAPRLLPQGFLCNPPRRVSKPFSKVRRCLCSTDKETEAV